MDSKPSVRFADIGDIPDLTRIFNQAIRSRYATGFREEFSVDERRAWFDSHSPLRYPLYVLEAEGVIAGYGTLSPYREGRAAMDKVAEVSFFLATDYQGRGLGTLLLDHMITDCPRLGIDTIVAMLMHVNLPSIGLLKKCGFEEWGNLPAILDVDGERIGHLIYGLALNR